MINIYTLDMFLRIITVSVSCGFLIYMKLRRDRNNALDNEGVILLPGDYKLPITVYKSMIAKVSFPTPPGNHDWNVEYSVQNSELIAKCRNCKCRLHAKPRSGTISSDGQCKFEKDLAWGHVPSSCDAHLIAKMDEALS